MARAHLRHTVRDRAGNAVQNALVNVYLQGTTTAVSDMYAASSGGSTITTLTSNAQGEVEAWFTDPRTVDLKVTDNSDAAYYPADPATLLSFTQFTETVEVQPPPADFLVRFEHGINPKHHLYGAVGDGSTDDTTALQAAIDACLDSSAAPASNTRNAVYPLKLTDGTYKVTGALNIKSISGFTMEGQGRKTVIQAATGSTFTNVLNLNGLLGATFRDFLVNGPVTSGSVDACIDFYWDSTAAQRSTTGCSFENIIVGTNNGRFITGFGVSRLSNGAKQVDHTRFDGITVSGGSSTDGTLWQHGFYWGSGTQGNQTDYYLNGTGVALCKYGHYGSTAKNLTILGGSYGALDTFMFVNGLLDVSVKGINFENVGRIVNHIGATSAPNTFELSNCKINGAINSDGQWFRWFSPGVVKMTNVIFGPISGPAGGTAVKIHCTPTDTCVFIFDGIGVPEAAATFLPSTTSPVYGVVSGFSQINRTTAVPVEHRPGPFMVLPNASGGGVGGQFIANVVTAPGSTPSGGGVLYVDSGALKFKGSSGTVTTIANA